MKNQRKKVHKRQMQGVWVYQFKSMQEMYHTDNLNHIKVAHRKKVNEKK